MPRQQVTLENIHGTAIVVGDRGLLVTGHSGSGKTTLALSIRDYFDARGTFSRLVSDDQLFVEGRAGRLVCHAPDTIAGLAEVPGLGPQRTSFEPAAVIDLVIRLVPTIETARLQEEANETIAGCTIPRIDLAERAVIPSLLALRAWLALVPLA